MARSFNTFSGPRRWPPARNLGHVQLVIDEVGFRPLDRKQANLFGPSSAAALVHDQVERRGISGHFLQAVASEREHPA